MFDSTIALFIVLLTTNHAGIIADSLAHRTSLVLCSTVQLPFHATCIGFFLPAPASLVSTNSRVVGLQFSSVSLTLFSLDRPAGVRLLGCLAIVNRWFTILSTIYVTIKNNPNHSSRPTTLSGHVRMTPLDNRSTRNPAAW